jgi:hypothetical protein
MAYVPNAARTVAAPASVSSPEYPLWFPAKSPTERLDYSVDFSAPVGASNGDSIASVTLSLDGGASYSSMQCVLIQTANNVVSFFLSSGQEGETHNVTVDCLMQSGDVISATVQLLVTALSGAAARAAVSPPRGQPGPAGATITAGSITPSGHLVFTKSDGSSLDVGYVVGPPGTGATVTEFVFSQPTPATSWVINHTLNYHPAVRVVDSAGTLVEGDVTYPNANTVVLTFPAGFSGTAYLS